MRQTPAVDSTRTPRSHPARETLALLAGLLGSVAVVLSPVTVVAALLTLSALPAARALARRHRTRSGSPRPDSAAPSASASV